MNKCAIFKCEYWDRYICCHTCPKRTACGNGRCHNVCQNKPDKCGAYSDELIEFDMEQQKRDRAESRRTMHRKENDNVPKFKVGDHIVRRRPIKPEGFNGKVLTVKAVGEKEYKLITKGYHTRHLQISYVNAAYKLSEGQT